MSKLHHQAQKIMVGLASIMLSALPVACNQKQPPITPSSPSADFPLVQSAAENSVRVGILVIDSAVSVNERYSPLLNYLSEVTGYPFELAPLSQESQFTEVAEGNLDFVTSNPLASVQIRRLYQTQFLVTHVRPNTGSEFSGLIIVDSKSNIRTLEDLRDKRGACVNFETAAAGCTFQIYHLKQRGLDPFTDFSQFIENKSQDNIVLALLNGTIDVGFIRTGQLEKMLEKGLISSLDEVRILEPYHDNFFYEHTTELYPEWPIAALTSTDKQLTEEVREALLSIPPEHRALDALKVDGFIPAVDYVKMEQLIESLKLKSWDVN